MSHRSPAPQKDESREDNIHRRFKARKQKSEAWISSKKKPTMVFIKVPSGNTCLESKSLEHAAAQTTPATYWVFDQFIAQGCFAQIFRSDFTITTDGTINRLESPKALKLFASIDKNGREEQAKAIYSEHALLDIYSGKNAPPTMIEILHPSKSRPRPKPGHQPNPRYRPKPRHQPNLKQFGIISEFIDGQTFAQVLEETKSSSIGDRVAQAINLLQAYNNIFKRHILHGDIKPENIMLRPNGSVVFIDFGTGGKKQGKITPTEVASKYSMVSSYLIGTTTDYQAPEVLDARITSDDAQLTIGAIDDEQSSAPDIYSLGMIVGQLLTTEPLGHFTRIAPGKDREPIPPAFLKTCVTSPIKGVHSETIRTSIWNLITAMTTKSVAQRCTIQTALASLKAISKQLSVEKPSPAPSHSTPKVATPVTKNSEDENTPQPHHRALSIQSGFFSHPKPTPHISDNPHYPVITFIALAGGIAALAFSCPPLALELALSSGWKLTMMLAGIALTTAGTANLAAELMTDLTDHCCAR